MSDNPQDKSGVLDTLQLILQEVTDPEIRKKLYYLAKRGLGPNQDSHPLCGALFAIAKKDVQSKNLARRKHALLLYTIFHQNWDLQECMPILFKLLSDSDQNIREIMKNAVIVNQLFDLDLFMICTVQSNTTGSLEETLSNHSRLPIMKNIGVDVNRIAAENNNNTTNDIYSSDALNIEWYKSEKHKKLQHSYGLPDSLFAKNTHPLTVSVLGEIHQRVGEVIREIRPKNKALFNISPNAMLARIVDLHPNCERSC
jgi:hypothetical protein